MNMACSLLRGTHTYFTELGMERKHQVDFLEEGDLSLAGVKERWVLQEVRTPFTT
jgi:hypothetical protein